MKKNRPVLFIGILVVLVYNCTGTTKGPEYYNPEPLATHFNGEHYVGSQTCAQCHADIYDSHVQSAHFNTSALANEDNIKGSFEQGSHRLKLEDGQILMKEQGGAFYQHLEFEGMDQQIPPGKIDIVIGSGVKGQSYLTWEEEKLFQLQASYYPPTNTWINSPGYPSHYLQRPIRDGCLKCHVTFAKNLDFSGKGNRYDKSKIVYGIDCESCHNPAGKHVVFHRNNPEVKTAKYMLKLDTLSRQQRLDACAQCHSGPRANIIRGNSFSYLTGENLKEYSRNFYTGQQNNELDVHGNQYGLLMSSKCFELSVDMDCSTCHDSHKKQRGKTADFNQKCMTCHETNKVSCTVEPSKLSQMANNCIACHMPERPSKLMSMQLSADSMESPVMVRTHLIKPYLEDLFENDAPEP